MTALATALLPVWPPSAIAVRWAAEAEALQLLPDGNFDLLVAMPQSLSELEH